MSIFESPPPLPNPTAQSENAEAPIDDATTPVGKSAQQPYQPIRERLQDTREAITHKFNIAGHEGYFIVGLFPDGRPGELFIKMSKEGSTISGLMDTVGILTSLTLQYGVPVETLAHKLEHVRFEPSGWTPNQEIGEAHSVIDYIFRWLGMRFDKTYRADKQLSHHPPDADPTLSAADTTSP